MIITILILLLIFGMIFYNLKIKNQLRLKKLRKAHDYKVHHPHCGLKDSNSFNFFKKSPRLK